MSNISKFFYVKNKFQFCFRDVRLFTNFPNTQFSKNLVSKHLLDLKSYLRSNRFSIKDGYTCLQIKCRLCRLKNENQLAFVNKKTGTFLCPKCDVKKHLSDIVHFYELGQQLHENPIEFPEYCMQYFDHLSDVTQDVCDIFKIKNLLAKDLNSLGVRYNSLSQSLHIPLKNVINKVVGEKIYNIATNTEETFQRDIQSGLLIHGQQNKTNAIVVTNIVDFFVILSHNFDNYAVVCLPYNLKSLPQECLPGLETFCELVFWFEFDSPGWDAARAISQKLNEKRCLLIRPTETEPTPWAAYKKCMNLRHILAKAMPVFHKSITNFSALKSDVLSELQNVDKVNGVKWKRFPVLNKLLKGHRKGELTIITGPTGSGKTTFMSEYSLDLALQGVSTLWGSFEIRNSRLASTLLRQFVGYSLEKRLNEFEHWSSEFEKYPLYFMTFHGQQSIKIVMEAIEHAQYVLDISHVIIDNLQFMMGVSTNIKYDRFWEQDEIIASFRSFATKRNVHVTLVIHPRKERTEDELTTSSVFGSAKATQEADVVLIIQDKRLVSVRGKKYLQISKNRFSGDLGIMPLEFDKEALSYASQKKKDNNK